jgi:hypothetical protein
MSNVLDQMHQMVADVVSLDNKQSTTDKPKETPKKKKKKMKKWSDDPSVLVQYIKLISPLKDVINKGYKLIRNDVKSFDYEGYNIGKQELEVFPSPKNQFTEKYLAKENNRNVKLIDIVLHIAFLLGVEQGRRSERKEQKSVETLINTIEQYRETNKNLRYQIDEIKATAKVKLQYPALPEQDLIPLIKKEITANRDKRIQELKKDLQLDPIRSSFAMKTQQRAKFNDLCDLARTFDKKTYDEHWLSVLKEYGWTLDEWNNKCKKKNKVIIID